MLSYYYSEPKFDGFLNSVVRWLFSVRVLLLAQFCCEVDRSVFKLPQRLPLSFPPLPLPLLSEFSPLLWSPLHLARSILIAISITVVIVVATAFWPFDGRCQSLTELLLLPLVRCSNLERLFSPPFTMGLYIVILSWSYLCCDRGGCLVQHYESLLAYLLCVRNLSMWRRVIIPLYVMLFTV